MKYGPLKWVKNIRYELVRTHESKHQRESMYWLLWSLLKLQRILNCKYTFLVKVQLKTEVLRTPSSIRMGLNSWLTAISNCCKRNVLPLYLIDLRWFQMLGLSEGLMHWQLIFLVEVRLRIEVLRASSSIQMGFELMTSRSWQYISCHWDSCSTHSAISD